ncbi:hypothetical protein C8A03DRAFT_39267 [Achaetomium macrosporum]|uniref:SnoaL-like domain-containing protein n=1 Tax=Achaetomium macrosporum TaxID=79813 RepID=A0AAN7H368_9PEZI|nr:hypothetical protein C8A03DRAFT_39267 [Achaetomium macrosporum]
MTAPAPGSARPLTVPENVTTWVATSFKYGDSHDPALAEKFGTLFTDDAEVYTPLGMSKGPEAIVAMLKKAWEHGSTSHTAKAIYTRDLDFSDVLAQGVVTMPGPDGQQMSVNFVAQINFVPDGCGGVKASLWKFMPVS